MHYWESFNAPSRQVAEEAISFLLTNRYGIFESPLEVDGITHDPQDRPGREDGRPTLVDVLPSIEHIRPLASLGAKLHSMRHELDARATIALFTIRLRHQHSGVVLLTLKELATYLRRQQASVQAMINPAQEDNIVAKLIRGLMDCAVRHNGSQVEVGILCVECLGLIGCVDPNVVECHREQRSFVVLENFEDRTETREFVLFLLEEVAIKMFRSTGTDTVLQGFISYVMQELLVFCEIKRAVDLDATIRERAVAGPDDATFWTTPEAQSRLRDIHDKWMDLADTTREDLRPFLESRYSVTAKPGVKARYPIFSEEKPDYAAWLKNIVLDLLHGLNTDADLIFTPLRRVILARNLSMAEFLLPYLFVHVVVSPKSNEERIQNITGELLTILNRRIYEENEQHRRQEELKRFCGVSQCDG